MHPFRLNIVVLALAALSLYSNRTSADLVTRPLPVELDGVTSPSGFFITFSEHDYKQPASVALKSPAIDSPEEVLRELLQTVTKNDVTGFRKLVNPAELDGVQDAMALYTDAFKKSPDPEIVLSVELGEAKFIITDLHDDTPGMAFLFIKTAGGWRNSLKLLDNPLVQELSLLFQEMRVHPEKYKVVDPAADSVRIELPPVFGDKASGVHLSFRGDRTIRANDEPLHEPIAPKPPADESAQKAFDEYNLIGKTLYAGPLNTYLSYFGPESRVTIENEIKGHSDGLKVLQLTSTASTSPVIFVVDGGTVFNLIHRPAVHKGKALAIQVESMIKADNGSLLIVNYAFESELSQLLTSPVVSTRIVAAIQNIPK